MVSTRRVSVRGIIVKDGKLFAVKHKDEAGNPANYWATPGGGLDVAEPILEGLHREMIEETGIAPRIGRLLLIQQFIESDKDREQLEFFFHIENAEEYETVNLAATTHGHTEIYECGFIDPATEPILPMILRTLDLEEYTKNVLPAVVVHYGEEA